MPTAPSLCVPLPDVNVQQTCTQICCSIVLAEGSYLWICACLSLQGVLNDVKHVQLEYPQP